MSKTPPRDVPDRDNQREAIWALLTRGAADKRSALNTPAIATLGPDGEPRVRTVVLRTCRPSQRQLEFHTDVRSDKVGELRVDNRLVWHVWDQKSRQQLRLRAVASLHHDDATAKAAWDKLHSGSRAIYRQAASPGRPVSDPAAAASEQITETEALANFVCVITTVATIDWLHLAPDGHRRARWTWDPGDSNWQGQWLAP